MPFITSIDTIDYGSTEANAKANAKDIGEMSPQRLTCHSMYRTLRRLFDCPSWRLPEAPHQWSDPLSLKYGDNAWCSRSRWQVQAQQVLGHRVCDP